MVDEGNLDAKLPKTRKAASTGVDRSKRRFLQYKRGIGKRLTYSYRIFQGVCNDKGHEFLDGKIGRGRIKKPTCPRCGSDAQILWTEKHKVSRS